ncbi:MAG: 30S ribosomal protein S6 [Saprospiraceae bacterium]|nr:30S ribosomal protein S6 [Saprospiraceae bacterium]MBK9630629.1 30S ribosomal protein S6 [Saprospiraceae bacterium]
MKHFEVSFIVDPVLSDDEVKSTAQTYQEMLTNEGASIVHVDEMGLKPLAYPINKRSTGVYFCIEFSAPNGSLIGKMELAMKRDERIMRYLTVSLDKFGVKYNEDKRNGKIGKKIRKEKPIPVLMNKPYVPKAAAAIIPDIIADDLVDDIVKIDA